MENQVIINTKDCCQSIKMIQNMNQTKNTCQYKRLHSQLSEIILQKNLDQCRDYLSKFSVQLEKKKLRAKIGQINQIGSDGIYFTSNKTIFKIISKIGKIKLIEVISTTLREEVGINHEENQEIIELISKNKHNMFKNILQAFKKHINDCQDQILIQIYQSLSEDKWDFDHIKQRVCTNLGNCGRFNLKIKNLSKNRNLNKIFNHFLKNSEKFWLKNSKIQNKELYIQQIKLLVKAQERNILQNFTQHYKKQRKYGV